MLARLTAFVIWGLVAATAVFWGLRLLVRPQPAPAYAVAHGSGSDPNNDGFATKFSNLDGSNAPYLGTRSVNAVPPL